MTILQYVAQHPIAHKQRTRLVTRLVRAMPRSDAPMAAGAYRTLKWLWSPPFCALAVRRRCTLHAARCTPQSSTANGLILTSTCRATNRWAEGAWDTMAMGNFPYASSYLLHGLSLLPPWPVRTACSHLAGIKAASVSDDTLFDAVRAAVAVFYNNTGDKACFDINDYPVETMANRHKMISPMRRPIALASMDAKRLGVDDRTTSCRGDWGYQWCTEMVQPFTRGTERDMYFCPNGTFYPARNCSSWDVRSQGCERSWGVTPRPEWASVALGGKRITGTSNIVFSNGLLDPWHGGGVLTNLSDSLLAILLPSGAHHIDLMFSDPEDKHYPDIGWARDFERAQIARWVAEHALRRETRREAKE